MEIVIRIEQKKHVDFLELNREKFLELILVELNRKKRRLLRIEWSKS